METPYATNIGIRYWNGRNVYIECIHYEIYNETYVKVTIQNNWIYVNNDVQTEKHSNLVKYSAYDGGRVLNPVRKQNWDHWQQKWQNVRIL